MTDRTSDRCVVPPTEPGANPSAPPASRCLYCTVELDRPGICRDCLTEIEEIERAGAAERRGW